MKVLKVMRHEGCRVYLRMIDKDIFMYDLIYNDEIYSSYMIFTPRNGTKSLSVAEIESATALIWSGAVATINSLLGIKLKDDVVNKAETFLDVLGTEKP